MSDNFDVEIYRKENPMDYLKAVEIFNSASNKEDVFNALYKITRFHIPNKLFKYYSLTDDEELNIKKLNTLANKQVFLADSKDFNDPFDNKAFYYDHNELINKGINFKNPNFLDTLLFNSKSTSFTEAGHSSILMWSHYSSNHKGFCVEYDMTNKENSKLSSIMFPIQYTDKRTDITDIICKYLIQTIYGVGNYSLGYKSSSNPHNYSLPLIISFLQKIKSIEWKYEKEYRCTAYNSDIGMPFFSASPSKIYAGEKCLSIHKKSLSDISLILSIPIYEMRILDKNKSFELNPVIISS